MFGFGHWSCARRWSALAVFASLLIGSWPATSLAQDGPITLLVAFPAGGGVDRAARVLAEKLGPELGRTIVVDNRPGAGGMLAARLLKAAATDGSVLLMTNSHPLITVPHTVRNVGYDPFKDFIPVSNFVEFQDVLVSTGEAKTFDELKAAAKRDGKPLNVGVPAPASLPEFVARAIGRQLGVEVQPVPYKGVAPLVQDLLGRQLELGIVTVTEALIYEPAGKFKVLAVSNRTAMMPNTPAYSDLGLKGLDGADFIGVFAPAGVPPAVVKRYATAIHRVGAMPEVVAKAREQGQLIETSTGAAFTERIQRMSRSSAELIKASGFKPE